MFEFGAYVSLDEKEMLMRQIDEYLYFQKLLTNFEGIIIGKRFEKQNISHYWIADSKLATNIYGDSFEEVSNQHIKYVRTMAWYKLSNDITNYIGRKAALVPEHLVIPNQIEIILFDKDIYKQTVCPKIGQQFLLKIINKMVEIVEISQDQKTAWVELIKQV